MKVKCVSKSNSLLFSITGCRTKVLSIVDLHFLNPVYLSMKTASFIILASLSLFWIIHFISAIKNTNIPIVVTFNLICFLEQGQYTSISPSMGYKALLPESIQKYM